MTHEIAGLEPAHGSNKTLYLRGGGRRQKTPEKRLFNPFDTRFDTRRHVSGHMHFLPLMHGLGGTDWQTLALAEKKEKKSAGVVFVESFHFPPLSTSVQKRNKVPNSNAAFLTGMAYSLTIPFITLQNAAL